MTPRDAAEHEGEQLALASVPVEAVAELIEIVDRKKRSSGFCVG
jgi:hypothetical protein